MALYRWQQNILNDPASYKVIRALRTSGKTRIAMETAKKAVLKGENVLFIAPPPIFTELESFFMAERFLGNVDAMPFTVANSTLYFERDGHLARDYGMIYFHGTYNYVTNEALRLNLAGRKVPNVIVDDARIKPYQIIPHLTQGPSQITIIGSMEDDCFNDYINLPEFKYFEYNHIQAVMDGVIPQQIVNESRRYFIDPDMFKNEFGPWLRNRLNRDTASSLELIHA